MKRRRFAQVSHGYLIEQVQEQQLLSGTTNTLNFNHPVKELIWTSTDAEAGEQQSCSLHSPCPIGTEFTLQLNGHERFSSRESTYFSRTQIYEHHTGPGGLFSELHTEENSIDFAMAFGAGGQFDKTDGYSDLIVSSAWKGKTDGSGFLLDWNAAGASDEANLFRRAAFRNRFRYAQKGNDK